MGDASAPVHKKRNRPQPEGRQAKCDTHRTDYEGAVGPTEIQWLPGITPDKNRLDKNGGLGSPRRAFAYFSRVGKVGLRSIPA